MSIDPNEICGARYHDKVWGVYRYCCLARGHEGDHHASSTGWSERPAIDWPNKAKEAKKK